MLFLMQLFFFCLTEMYSFMFPNAISAFYFFFQKKKKKIQNLKITKMPYKQIFNFYENDEHVLIFSAYTLYTSVYIFMHI